MTAVVAVVVAAAASRTDLTPDEHLRSDADEQGYKGHHQEWPGHVHVPVTELHAWKGAASVLEAQRRRRRRLNGGGQPGRSARMVIADGARGRAAAPASVVG